MQWCSAGTFFLQSHFWPGTCSGHSMGWKQMLSELNHDWCVVAAAVETCHEKGQRCSRIKIIETVILHKYEIYHLPNQDIKRRIWKAITTHALT